MSIIRYFVVIYSFALTLPLAAQQAVKGRVNDFTNDTIRPIVGATITNINSKQSTEANYYGYYSINASENDVLVFSHIGYIGDTVKVQEQFFISGYDAALIEEAAFLRGVTVYADYRRDSIRRRQEYAYAYEKPLGITGGNTPSAGFGIVLSPSSIFSKKRKSQKRLKNNLEKQEQEAYINYVFSPDWVSTLTGLKGEALTSFVNKYRPTYQFCRTHSRTEMMVYINDKYKEFQGNAK